MATHLQSTRELLLDTAERLFAEHGIGAVSNRRVAEEAGAANNSAVRYHFGTKTDLIMAVTHRYVIAMEEVRERMLAEIDGSEDPRDYLSCLVVTPARYLAGLGRPTWLARFMLQARTDPALHLAVLEAEASARSQQRARAGLLDAVTWVDPAVVEQRGSLAEMLIVHTYADYEREVAEGGALSHPDWESVGRFLADAVGGMLLAPVSVTR